MNLKDLVLKTRTCRRFDESHRISPEILESLADLARLSTSGGNRQPLKYLLYHSSEDCEKIFSYLSWAAYLNEWPGPARGERPSAYIVVIG